MSRRDPRSARILGLWTAFWLGGLLLAGLLWVGDLAVQWPVLVVPLLWALVALRPRRRARGEQEPDDEDDWQPIPPPERPDLAVRTDTVERPALRNRHADDDWR